MFETSPESRLSAHWLRATAARLHEEVGALVALDGRIATFGIDGEIRFASAADRAAFVDELGGFLIALVGRYHAGPAVGRDHRVMVAVHPCVKERPTMGREFRRENQAEVQASPEQVWEAIATGPGVNSWFMGRTQIEDGVVATAFADFTLTHRIEAAEPGTRFAYASEKSPEGRFEAYEFLIEGREGAATVLRAVTSGFLPGEDWAEEFEAMSQGLDLFFATLVAYLENFAGRAATPLTVAGHLITDWPGTRSDLFAALGVSDPKPGDTVAFTVPGLGRIDGTVYHVSDHNLGIRTGDAMYRFVRGFQGPLLCMHHLFGDASPTTEKAWRDFLLALPH